MRQIGFCKGSTPPSSISFCLDIQNTVSEQIPDTSSNVIPASVIVRSPLPFPPIRAPKSPSSTDSNVDVTTYAEEKIQLHETAQKLAGQQIGEQIVEDPEEVGEEEKEEEEEEEEGKEEEKEEEAEEEEEEEEEEAEEEERNQGNEPENLTFAHAKTDATTLLIQISTPTPGTTETAEEINLTQLETGLRLATSSRTVLPELLPTIDPVHEV